MPPKALVWIGGVVTAVVTAALVAAVTAAVSAILPLGDRERTDPAVPDASPAPPVSASPSGPLLVAAEVSDSDCGNPRLLPAELEEIDFSQGDGGLGGGRGWGSYPVAAGSYPASGTWVVVTVQGTSERVAVVLTGLEVVVTGRSPAPSGTVLSNPCGGDIIYRWLSVDLDREPPAIEPHLDESRIEMFPPVSRVRPIEFPYTVTATDPEVFLISPQTVDCDCRWHAVLSWQSAGQTGREVINDGGSDFRTVATTRAGHTCDVRGECRPR